MEKFIEKKFETEQMVATLNEMDKQGYKLLHIVAQKPGGSVESTGNMGVGWPAVTTAIFELKETKPIG